MATEKRLIDAAVFAEHLERMTRTAYPNLFPGLLEAADYAKDFPTVDAVEVVRCKDCKHGMKSRMQPGHAKNILCKHSWYGDYHEPDHFCSYGERKNDG